VTVTYIHWVVLECIVFSVMVASYEMRLEVASYEMRLEL